MLSTQARSAFVSIDEGRAGSCGSSLGIWLCFVCADDVLSRCDLKREWYCLFVTGADYILRE
ncbi:hypothetical protein HMPREF3208_01299 [Gardnerella vaginalis]|uniref:Uncharacterized protein n=1 Tax=Gardnerella vaginalis TaxID=2702 RepID=A0A133NRL7_GARVA|nr:hypothetical protein HMPREF3208_01299 [Gardnerella vaginalis]